MMSRRIIILTVSGSIVIAVLILGAFEGHTLYLKIGLATVGTIWWRSALPRFPYPQVGGIIGGFVATILKLMLLPMYMTQYWPFYLVELVGLAFVVSVFVTQYFPPATSKDNK